MTEEESDDVGQDEELQDEEDLSPAELEEKALLEAADESLVWQRNPSWKGMVIWYLEWGSLALGLSFTTWAFWQWSIWPAWLFFLTFLVSFGSLVVIGRLVRKTTIYTIKQKKIVHKYGILNTTKDQAPIGKITNISVRRTIAERIIGIGKIEIDTASDLASREALIWWGVEDPYSVEAVLDGLRAEVDDD